MPHSRLVSSAFLALALNLASLPAATTAHAQASGYRIDTIALTGEPLPGTGGATVDLLFGFDLNSAGDLIVLGDWQGASEGTGSGLWLWQQGVLNPVALSEAPVPGVAGEVFGPISGNSPRLNSAGNVAFITRGSSTAIDRPSLYSGNPENLSLVARVGEPAPGAGGLLFETLDLSGMASATGGGATGPYYLLLYGPALNSNGDFVFMAHLADCVDCGVPAVREDGLWLNTASGLELIALTGDPAPGTAGSTFAKFLHYSLNDAGQIAFRALLDDPSTGNQGLWIGTPGNFTLIAKTGDEAPGTGGLSFTEFASEAEFGPALSASGDFFFRAFVNSGDQANDAGLWLFRNGIIEPVVRAGEPAPGSTAAIQSLDEPQINGSGDIAFLGSFPAIYPDQDQGIWLGAPESPTLLVRSGDPVPGLPGETFLQLNGLALNASGQIAFQAQVDPNQYEFGVWVAAFTGIFPIIYPGQQLEVKAGDLRTVRSAYLFGNLNKEGGLITSFNDSGQAMLFVEFDDWTSGVFLATPVDPTADQPPVADAGPDQTVSSADSVMLDGTGSFDPEGSPLTYRWSLDGAQIATGPTPTVGPFAVGAYTVALTVTDQAGLERSDTMSLTVRPPNMPPLAEAGPDQTVDRSQLVTLDGLGSGDPEGEALAYLWTLDGIEVGTNATITVGPLSIGTHIATLTVTDPHGASASDNLTITVVNRAPIAQAGPDRTVNHATIVNLDGSGSHDPDGDTLSYAWSLNGAQIGTGVIAPVGPFDPGSHTIELTVTDTFGASATDSLVVTVINDPPVADAGPDQTIRHSTTVMLDGSGSSDPEGEPLSYAWSLGGQQIASGATPTVGPFSPGTYTIDLTVSDSRGATASDILVLTVTNQTPVADAGPDQTVQGPKIVTLDGSGSADPDGDAFSYAWSLDGIEIATGPRPSAGPFADGSHTIGLTVTDSAGATSTDSMTLMVLNAPPIADAGPDQTIAHKKKEVDVTLDGSASVDADGTIISYLWTRDGAVVASGVTPTLRLKRGAHVLDLTVTDDDGATASDQVVITIVKGTQFSGN